MSYPSLSEGHLSSPLISYGRFESRVKDAAVPSLFVRLTADSGGGGVCQQVQQVWLSAGAWRAGFYFQQQQSGQSAGPPNQDNSPPRC